MKCVICQESGPFTLEACVLDDSRPMCDKCAMAVDTIYDNEDDFDKWEKSYYWLDSKKKGIQDKDVSFFVEDVLNAAKAKPNYKRIESNIVSKRIAEEKAALQAAEAKHYAEIAPFNAVYEYAVESIQDYSDGSANIPLIRMVISDYASKGWRLHKTMVNEIGRTSQSSGGGGITTGTNATIDETILIFERCIKPLKKE